MKKGLLLVISGPSGVGKTTITHEVERRLGGVFSVSVTTRPKTAADVEGRDYFFISDEEFTRRREAGDLLESVTGKFGKYSYGTPRQPVTENLSKGHLFILEVDVHGALQVKAKIAEAFMLFVLPPSDEELLRRLRARGRDSDEAIQRRFKEAQNEIKTARESNAYDEFIVNDDLKTAIEQACDLVEKRRNAESSKR